MEQGNDKMKAVELTNDNKLIILDQTRLPGEVVFFKIKDKDSLIEAIIKLRVRGAPAIGIAAAYGIYVLACQYENLDKLQFISKLKNDINDIQKARPTAVNLAWALAQMDNVVHTNIDKNSNEIINILRKQACLIDEKEAAISQAIAGHGAALIKNGIGVLTHCNAGWLATSDLGTALAPIYLAQQKGRKFKVYCDETRPLLQGARLTTYELMQAGVDTTLICDNMAASLMSQGKIDIVFVGADRVAANGDVANKIGTLSVAINAAYFGIPLYVCAPSSTFDSNSKSGKDIIIEQRDADEVTTMWYSSRMAADNVNVENPAFDVTPHQLISGIITEEGIKSY